MPCVKQHEERREYYRLIDGFEYGSECSIARQADALLIELADRDNAQHCDQCPTHFTPGMREEDAVLFRPEPRRHTLDDHPSQEGCAVTREKSVVPGIYH